MPEVSTDSTYDAAVGYVKCGWAVVPLHGLSDKTPSGCTCHKVDCKSQGKHPRQKSWTNAKGKDLTWCQVIWEQGWVGGDYIGTDKINIGIVTGRVSGIFVLDIDPRNGGDEGLAELIAKYGELPQTYTVRTGQGGRHFYFNMPDFEVSNKKREIPDGIDVKGDGGQVVAPPSCSIFGDYWVEVDAPIVDAPDWLLELLKTDPKVTSGSIVMAQELPHRDTFDHYDQTRLYNWAMKGIESECDAYQGAPWHHGGIRLYAACCNILEILQSPWSGIDIPDARRILERARAARYKRAQAELRFDNGQLPDQLEATWASAARKVAGKGRAVPPDNRHDGVIIPPFDFGAATQMTRPSPFMQPTDPMNFDDETAENVIIEAETVALHAAQVEYEQYMQAAVIRKAQELEVKRRAEEYDKVKVAQAKVSEDAVAALLGKMLRPADLDELPNPRYLIRNLLRLNSECWLVAPPGSFKSFVAFDWSAHIAAGKDWRGERTEQGTVVYVVAEGADGIKLRKKAWERLYGPMDDGVYFLPEPVQVLDTAAWDVLVEVCRRLDPALVVLDTQSRLTVGLDENSPLMNIYVEAVRKIRSATQACVCTLHHPKQGGVLMRGHGTTLGASDSVLILSRPNKNRNLLTATLSIGKQKEGDEDATWEIQMEKIDLGTDYETGDELNSLALKPRPPFGQPPVVQIPEWEENLSNSQSIILRVMRDHADPETGATRAQILKWISERLREQGNPQLANGTVDSGLRRLKELKVLAQDKTRYFENEPESQ